MELFQNYFNIKSKPTLPIPIISLDSLDSLD